MKLILCFMKTYMNYLNHHIEKDNIMWYTFYNFYEEERNYGTKTYY